MGRIERHVVARPHIDQPVRVRRGTVGRQVLVALEGGVEEGIAGADRPAFVDIAEVRIDALAPRRAGVLEVAETVDLGGQQEDVVIGIGAVGADGPGQRPWQGARIDGPAQTDLVVVRNHRLQAWVRDQEGVQQAGRIGIGAGQLPRRRRAVRLRIAGVGHQRLAERVGQARAGVEAAEAMVGVQGGVAGLVAQADLRQVPTPADRPRQPGRDVEHIDGVEAGVGVGRLDGHRRLDRWRGRGAEALVDDDPHQVDPQVGFQHPQFAERGIVGLAMIDRGAEGQVVGVAGDGGGDGRLQRAAKAVGAGVGEVGLARRRAGRQHAGRYGIAMVVMEGVVRRQVVAFQAQLGRIVVAIVDVGGVAVDQMLLVVAIVAAGAEGDVAVQRIRSTQLDHLHLVVHRLRIGEHRLGVLGQHLDWSRTDRGDGVVRRRHRQVQAQRPVLIGQVAVGLAQGRRRLVAEAVVVQAADADIEAEVAEPRAILRIAVDIAERAAR